MSRVTYICILLSIMFVLAACTPIIDDGGENNMDTNMTNEIINEQQADMGDVFDTVSPNPNNTSIKLPNDKKTKYLDLSGTWVFLYEKGEGAEDENDNYSYDYLESAEIKTITFDPNGTGVIQVDNSSNITNFEWVYVHQNGENLGIDYFTTDAKDGFQIYFLETQQDNNVVLMFKDRTGGDDQYGSDFIRTVTLVKNDNKEN